MITDSKIKVLNIGVKLEEVAIFTLKKFYLLGNRPQLPLDK
jgi:hypothetical protein